MEAIGHDAKGLGEAFDGKPSRGVIHPLKREGCVHGRRQRGGRAHEMIVVADQVIGERQICDLRVAANRQIIQFSGTLRRTKSGRIFSTFSEFLKQAPPRDSRAFSALAAGARFDCVGCELAVALTVIVRVRSDVPIADSKTAHVKSRISASAA